MEETIYYHPGPPGVTEIRTTRARLDAGETTPEEVQKWWMENWDVYLELDELPTVPAINEIFLTTELSEAVFIAELQGGQVYRVIDPVITRENEEGYPVCQGPVACEPVDEETIKNRPSRRVEKAF